MNEHTTRRLAVLGVAATVAALAVGPGFGRTAVPGLPGIRLVGPEEVLREHAVEGPDGALLFTPPSGSTWRFVTSTLDPEIGNPGDGSFHPVEEAAVLAVLDAVPGPFLAPMVLTIYLLPYPRSGAVGSSVEDGAIFLSPGVAPYGPGAAARLVAHECGHAVHRTFLPVDGEAGWETYAALRGIGDAAVFRADAPHAWRPREIFAEDFRVIFGGDLAAGNGAVENPDLAPPDRVPGLAAFFWSLAGGDPAQSAVDPRGGPSRGAWRAAPNPVRGGEEFILRAVGPSPDGADPAAGAPAAVLLIDASGAVRRRGAPSGGGSGLVLPARDDDGRILAAGAYWIVLLGGHGARSAAVPVRVCR